MNIQNSQRIKNKIFKSFLGYYVVLGDEGGVCAHRCAVEHVNMDGSKWLDQIQGRSCIIKPSIKFNKIYAVSDQ
jgi:hypothetical protein